MMGRARGRGDEGRLTWSRHPDAESPAENGVMTKAHYDFDALLQKHY